MVRTYRAEAHWLSILQALSEAIGKVTAEMTDGSYQRDAVFGGHNETEQLILDLVRFGLDGEEKAIQHLSRRLLRRGGTQSEAFRKELGRLLVANSGPATRSATDVAIPVEPETQQPLATVRRPGTDLQPILAPAARDALVEFVAAREHASELIEVGVEPPRTLLLTGPPGVGKSMTAAALATQLQLPLIGVELATMMSSFLGKTGQNLARVLDHGRAVPCVLFLDEFDAVAKRRDDLTDIGELKRLVNMLLLELDNWPASGLLVAATNHPQLLDPAVGRRFDVIVDLGLPGFEERRAILSRAIDRLAIQHLPSAAAIAAVALALEGRSGADIERTVAQAARSSVLGKEPISEVLNSLVFDSLRSAGTAEREKRSAFAVVAAEHGMSQREIAEILEVTHPTVGKMIADWRARAEEKSVASGSSPFVRVENRARGERVEKEVD